MGSGRACSGGGRGGRGGMYDIVAFVSVLFVGG